MPKNLRHKILQTLAPLTLFLAIACQTPDTSCNATEKVTFSKSFEATQTVTLGMANDLEFHETLLAVIMRSEEEFKVSIADSVFQAPIASFSLRQNTPVKEWIGFQHEKIPDGFWSRLVQGMQLFYASTHAICNGNVSKFESAGVIFLVREMIKVQSCVFPKNIEVGFVRQSDFKAKVLTKEVTCPH